MIWYNILVLFLLFENNFDQVVRIKYMKIVLFAMNGSHSHTCLAIRCLRNSLEGSGFAPILYEANLRDRRDEVLWELYERRADLYSFSCYIWNIEEMLYIASDLKKLLPNTKIVFGGPEASFDIERFLDKPFIDYLICGEGEDAIVELCSSLLEKKETPRVINGGIPTVMGDEGILYRDDCKSGEMLYYESSRGCPYRCSYCLSSNEGKIRAKSVEQTLSDLLEFERLSTDIKIIKFVDRTFNFDKDRANKIWSALADEKYTKNYHFEICASLLDEESFSVLERLPHGKVQLEIGLQSTNELTLFTVSRHIDSDSVIKAAKRIVKMGNIHVHLDLIAGLPYEDYESFKRSFNDAYFACHMLQLGFLKLLHGTKLREDAKKYGIEYSERPPYTVLKTDVMSREDLHKLMGIADLLDRYYSSGKFEKCLDYAVKMWSSPFDFYEGLFDFLNENEGRGIRKLSQIDAFRVLYSYIKVNLSRKEADEFEFLMHEDFSRHEARRMPFSVLK